MFEKWDQTVLHCGNSIDGEGETEKGARECESQLERYKMNVLERIDSFRDEDFHLGPRIPLKQQIELDKDDESLRRWKEQLLGQLSLEKLSIDVHEPEVKILSLSMATPGLPDAIFTLPLTMSNGPAFTLQEGTLHGFKFTFSVQRNLVPGLTYVNKVWKAGVLVDQSRVMLGSFAPQMDPYTYIMEEEETPSGPMARGSYTAKTKFVDDDNVCYLEFDYSFQIVKATEG